MRPPVWPDVRFNEIDRVLLVGKTPDILRGAFKKERVAHLDCQVVELTT